MSQGGVGEVEMSQGEAGVFRGGAAKVIGVSGTSRRG